jgi:hypothetical protein
MNTILGTVFTKLPFLHNLQIAPNKLECFPGKLPSVMQHSNLYAHYVSYEENEVL